MRFYPLLLFPWIFLSLNTWACQESLVDPFPDPLTANLKNFYLYKGPGEYRVVPGMVTLKVELTAENLLFSYPKGIFPYFETGTGKHVWFSTPSRGIVDLNEMHLPTTLRELLRRGNYEITFDTAFRDVVLGCMNQERPGAWINQRVVREYTRLHEMGAAHSVEVRNLRGELVGGTYGVFANGIFSGESMFYKESGAGLVAFATMAAYLRQRGFSWMDTQFVSETTKRLGAKEIPIQEFFNRAAEARARGLSFKDPGDTSDVMVARLPAMEEFIKWVQDNELVKIRAAELSAKSKMTDAERLADKERKRIERERATKGKELLIQEKAAQHSFEFTLWYRLEHSELQKIHFSFPASYETFHEYFGAWLRDHVMTRAEFEALTDLNPREEGVAHGYDLGMIDSPEKAESLLALLKEVLSKRFREIF